MGLPALQTSTCFLQQTDPKQAALIPQASRAQAKAKGAVSNFKGE